jgi:NADH-quinone oxidoreductase subunit M
MLEQLLNPAERETDLIWLTVLTFLPAGMAIGLLLIPGRFKELMRWWAIFASAATLILSLCLLIDYYQLLDRYSDRSTRSLYHPAGRLDYRADQAGFAAAQAVPREYSSLDQFTRRPWVERFDICYALGVDGVSLAMILLTTLITLLAIVASWNIEQQLRGYLILVLILESGVIGAFLAVDLFLFYVFYELMLFPMFFLIGIWGGVRRKYAAFKFVVYTLLGSVGVLAAIIALYSVDVRDFVPQPEGHPRTAEVHTFDAVTLTRVGRAVMLVLNGEADRIGVQQVRNGYLDPGGRGSAGDGGTVPLLAPGVDRAAAIARLQSSFVCSPWAQYLLFTVLFLGFAVKVPIVPLHSWLPDAHVEAPTPISMILAGVLLKLGGYGLYRFALPLAPWAAAELAWHIGLLGVISMIYGAVVAMGQYDFKKLLAYSSISHMGYVVLGLASWTRGERSEFWEWGVNGAVFQMISHGITSAGLFFVVGIIYERAHHRDLNKLGGLVEPMPVFTGLSAILIFASLGLPGLCGFVGEFLVIVSAWNFCFGLSLGAILTTVITAAYLVWTWQRVYLGLNPDTAKFPELSAREFLVLFPLTVLAILLGVLPGYLVFQWLEPSIQGWIEVLRLARG